MCIKTIKEKLKKFKKWIVASVIGATALAAEVALQPPAIPFVEVNGQKIEFSYTDTDHTGENLIISADSGQIADVMYFMVENKSGIGQVINIQPLFSDKANAEFKISKLAKNILYEAIIPQYGTTTYDCSYTASSTKKLVKQTCEKQIISATSSETRYQDEWRLVESKGFTQHEKNILVSSKNVLLKDTKGYEPKRAIEQPILNQDIQYFKLEITKRQLFLNAPDEFFIEAIGSGGGYGMLDPWLTGWTYRKTITIDHTKVSADLANFPVLVKLSASNFTFSHALSTGNDIRFTSSDGTTLLKYERERHDQANSLAEYWVKVPSILTASDVVIYIYYGNSGASDGADPTNVWDSNYKAVYHLKDITTSTVEDSTVNNNDGAKRAANEPVEAIGKIAKAQDFDGINDYIKVGPGTNLDVAYIQVDMWLNMVAAPISIIDKTNSVVNSPYRSYAVSLSGSNKLGLSCDNGGTFAVIVMNADAYVAGLNHYTLNWNGTVAKIYKNGVETATANVNGSIGSHPTWNFYISNSVYGVGDPPDPFDGILDELRVSAIARLPAWIKADYNSENDSLVSYGSEETSAVPQAIIIE